MNENCRLTRKNIDAASKHVKIKSLYQYKVAETSSFESQPLLLMQMIFFLFTKAVC